MPDWLSDYDKATEEAKLFRQKAESAEMLRRVILRRMRLDGMQIRQIARLTGLTFSDVSRKINLAEREYQQIMGSVEADAGEH